MLRLLLIFSLAWALAAQPLLSSAGSAPAAREAGCSMASCCDLSETTTCCGERVVEQVCAKSGGACLCGAGSENTDPGPEAPLPRETNDLVLILLVRAPGVVIVPEPSPRALGRAVDLEPRSTRHETQALLCVWRT